MAKTTFSGPVASTAGFQADPSTAVTAGGGDALFTATTSAIGIYAGSGAPTISAAQGSIYLRTDGAGVASRLYINTTGSTTWTAVSTAA
jgi:hypothetical protein